MTQAATLSEPKFRIVQAAPAKIIFPMLLTVVLFVVTISFIILPRFETQLLQRKREMIHGLTEMAWSVFQHYAAKEQTGELTRTEAQDQAVEYLRRLRYGPELKDYFWINDMHPRMIMHPYRPDLEGQDLTDHTDPAGKPIFLAFVDMVRQKGAGFVDYQWQWQDNPRKVVPKISYVKVFAPWRWILGTGIYVEDLHTEIAAFTRRISLICLGIAVVIMGLSAYVIWQGAGVESKRRNAERILRQSEAKYRLLAETAHEFIITCDPQGHIIYANNAWLRANHCGTQQMLDKNIAAVLQPDQAQNFLAKLERLSRSADEDYFLETEFVTRQGNTLPVEVTIAVMRHEDATTGYLIAARDITEKKRAEAQAKLQQEQLFQSAKMASLGTLVSGVAHEINNPISAVMLNVQIFEKFWQRAAPILNQYHNERGDLTVGGLDYPQLRERMPRLLNNTADGAARVKRIVSDLKAFAGKSPSDLRDGLDLNASVQRAVSLVSSLIKKATEHFQEDYAPEMPKVRGNSQRIEQVVINLLVNACQAMNDKSKSVSVRTGVLAEAQQVFIEVQDNGAGISPKLLQRIKDPFFTTKRDSGGTGLGLSISDTIVRDHSGRLEFHSEPGQGTTARVILPAGQQPPSTGEQA